MKRYWPGKAPVYANDEAKDEDMDEGSWNSTNLLSQYFFFEKLKMISPNFAEEQFPALPVQSLTPQPDK
jgi:hypothetical protein